MVEKLITTYLNPIPKLAKHWSDGKVRFHYNQLGARTGRFTSGGVWKFYDDETPVTISGLNGQNLPSENHEIRLMFKAEPGRTFVGGDISQQEPKITAHISQDDNMLKVFREGKDIYASIAQSIFHNKYEDNLEFFDPEKTQINLEGKKRRKVGKTVILATMYGMSAGTVARKLKLSSKEEAQFMIDAYYNQFPGVKKSIDDSVKDCKNKGYIEDICGRRRRLPSIQLPLYRTFEIESVRFKKELELEITDGVSVPEFEAFLTCCLYINYPEFAFHQTKADEINERFYENYPEFKLRFRPHFTWKGNKVVKIGIRLSNEFCNKEKEERKLLLDQYGFHLEKDVRSSVPRLTLSINEGHWIDEELDIYELINNEFDPGFEFNETRRDAIKYYMLRTYFDLGSNKELGRNVMSNINKAKLDIPGVQKVEIDELMGRLRDAAYKVLGGRTFGSDIFYIESCVYLMTLYDLLTSGHMVWLVYDAFYSNGEEDDETFKEMVANSVRLNFTYFMETSTFKMFSKAAADQEGEIENKIAVRDILEKYNLCVSEGDI